MLAKFQNHIESHLPFLKTHKLLIAISGGIDSVVLTHLCHQWKLDIALAHCNFSLRGEESDTDALFVTQYANQLEVEVFTQRFDTDAYAKKNKCSIQMAARELRYTWFTELAEQLGFDYILTAHHADDNLETFLINVIRGTGLEGLTGIPEVNGKFVRPLLPFSSLDIENYVKVHRISWRTDSSNKSVKYLRNKLRHEVVPILKTINPSLLQSFHSTITNVIGSSQIIKDHIDTFLEDTAEAIAENEFQFKIENFKKLDHPKPYLFEVFKDYGFTAWDDVLNLLDAQSGKQVLSQTHRLVKNRSHLLLSPIPKKDFKPILISAQDISMETPLGTLSLETVQTQLDNKPPTIYVDRELLQFPLILRKPESGDVFYPYGMSGKKKLSKYFKDEKLSLLDKEKGFVVMFRKRYYMGYR